VTTGETSPTGGEEQPPPPAAPVADPDDERDLVASVAIEDQDTSAVGPEEAASLGKLPEPGDTVGDYAVLRFLAEGGMGRIYVAQAPDGRRVALKILRFLDETLQQRFEREGAVLGTIHHPNVVQLLGRGVDPASGLGFIALEYVHGLDLTQLLNRTRDRRLSVAEAAFVIERCAQGLAATHAQGVLHRDLKLSNVLVTRAGQVKLTDFGLALPADASVRLTAPDFVMGTLHYLAPEVITGAAWTREADLYGLGCVAFRLLAGRPPREGALQEVLRAHKHDPVPSLAALNPEVPPALSDLIGRVLAKSPEARPNAPGLARELKALGLVEDADAIARGWSQGLVGSGSFPALPARPAAATPPARRPDPARSDDALAQSLAGDPAESGEHFELSASGERIITPTGQRPAERIGPYVVVRRLGRGAMGEVFLAAHAELGTRYALKVLAPELVDDETARRRFEAEMSSLASVDIHPAIVRVHTAGRTQKGRPYFAMEYVEGRSLKDALKGGLAAAEAVGVLRQVTEALAFAHEKELVHRDIKPENIMLGADGQVRLADFGLARAVQPGVEKLTRTGEMIGTPAYMAPEQAAGVREHIGPWTDVFALGAILYEVFAGVPPYMGKTAIEIYAKLIEGEPIPPLPDHEDLTPALRAVIKKALARRPGDRCANARVLLQSLDAALTGTAAAPTSPAIKVLAGLAAASLVMAALAVGFASLRKDRAKTGAGPVERLVADGAYEEAVEAGVRLLAAEGEAALAPEAAADVRAAVEEARVALLEAAFARGELDRARTLLEQVEGDVAARPWVLALSGEPAAALAAAPADDPARRARLAAWAGAAEAREAALASLAADAPARATALSLELAPFGAAPPPAPADDVERAGGVWPRVAAAERALAAGSPALAVVELEAAGALPGADGPEAAFALSLGLLRAELARGRLSAATEAWVQAWDAAEHPLDEGRCLAWGLALEAAAGGPVPAVTTALDESATARLAARAPGVPVATTRARGGPVWPLEAARAAVRAREPSRAREILATRLGVTDPEVSFARLERRLVRAGRDGPLGVRLARAIELAEAAEAARDPVLAGAAELALAAQERLRDGSPALWIAVGRAALARGDVDQAQLAADRALARSPADPAALLLGVRATAAAVQEAAAAADAARVTTSERAPEPEPELRVAALWAEVESRARAALEAAPDDPDLRLWLGRALVERARRRWLAGELDLDGVAAALDPALDEALSDLLPDSAFVEEVLARRVRLLEATVDGDGARVALLEQTLAELVAPLEPLHVRRALLLRAQAGLPDSVRFARLYLTVTGDVPARPLLAVRRAEVAPSAARRRALLDQAVTRYPASPHAHLAREQLRFLEAGVEPFGHDPAIYRALARVLAGAPGWTWEVLDLLHRNPSPPGPAEAAAVLAELAPDEPLARCLAFVAAGLDDADRAAAAARAAARAAPAPAARLLQAWALGHAGRSRPGRLDERLAAEIADALTLARARVSGPTPLRLGLVLGATPLAEALDPLMAGGFVTNVASLALPPGAPATATPRLRYDIEDALDELRGKDGLGKLDLGDDDEAREHTGSIARYLGSPSGRGTRSLPRLELALRLHLMDDGVTFGDGSHVPELERLLDDDALGLTADRRLRAEAFFFHEQARAFGRGQSAAAALKRAAAAGVRALAALEPSWHLAPVDEDLAPDHVPLLGAVAGEEVPLARPLARPAEDDLARLQGELERLSDLYRLLETARDDMLVGIEGEQVLARHELLEPWSTTAALLRGAQDRETGEDAFDWLKRRGERDEAALALIRASAFALTRSDGGFDLADEVEDEPWDPWLDPDDEAERAATFRGEGAAARTLLAVLPPLREDPRDRERRRRAELRAMLAGALLYRTGDLDAAEATPLLAEAAELLSAADPELLEHGDRTPKTRRIFAHWRRARAFGLTDDARAAAELTEVRDRFAASGSRRLRRRLARATLRDPLRPRLVESLPGYAELVADAEALVGDGGGEDEEGDGDGPAPDGEGDDDGPAPDGEAPPGGE